MKIYFDQHVRVRGFSAWAWRTVVGRLASGFPPAFCCALLLSPTRRLAHGFGTDSQGCNHRGRLWRDNPCWGHRRRPHGCASEVRRMYIRRQSSQRLHRPEQRCQRLPHRVFPRTILEAPAHTSEAVSCRSECSVQGAGWCLGPSSRLRGWQLGSAVRGRERREYRGIVVTPPVEMPPVESTQ